MNKSETKDQLSQRIESEISQNKGCCGGIFGRLGLYIKFAGQDYCRRKCLFCIGVFTIIICFVTSMISQSVISKTPIIFYNTAAIGTGELDIIVRPQFTGFLGDYSFFLNHTQVENVLAQEIDNLVTPRFESRMFISPVELNKTQLKDQTPYSQNSSVILIDVEKELQMEIDGDEISALEPGEAYVTDSLRPALGIEPGEIFYLAFWNPELDFVIKQLAELRGIDPNGEDVAFLIPIKLKEYKSGFTGRFEDAEFYNDVVVIDIKTIMTYMAPFIQEQLTNSPNFANLISEQNLGEYCQEIIINFKDRQDIYLNGNYDVILKEAVPLASTVTNLLSPYAIEIEMPIVEALDFTRFANTFISLVLNLILAGLLYLASFVIFNIMQITIDSKVYEAAVLRTMGLNRSNMIWMMIVNALGYGLLAILIGIFVSWYSFGAINNLIANVGGAFTIGFGSRNTIVSIILAIGIPVLSAVRPVMGLLKQNIAYALDKDHSKTSSLKIFVSNTEKRFPKEQFAVALTSTVIGLLIYIFLPLSLFSENITMFVLIFFGLLISMLIGVMMILVNFSYLFEMLLMIPLYLERKFIRTMVKMNLIAHRIKNRRTVIIYALSLSFINFIYVTLLMQIETSQVFRLRIEGAELVIETEGRNRDYNSLTVGNFFDVMERANLTDKIDYTMKLQRLDISLNQNSVGNYTLYNRGKIVNRFNRIYAYGPNYEDVARVDLNSVSQYHNEEITLNPAQYIHTRFHPGGTLMSVNIKEDFKLNCENIDDAYIMQYNDGNDVRVEEFTCAAAYAIMAGSYASRMPLQLNTHIVTSVPDYLEQGTFNDMPNYKYLLLDSILIKVKNQEEFSEIATAIKDQSILYDYDVFDWEEFTASFDNTNSILNILFMFVTIVSMSLSLFSLVSTMASNMIEQRMELAVMRCIGLDRFQIARIYLYEAIIVILTGGLIGNIAGMAIGTTIVAQNSLFMNTKVKVVFPWGILATVFVVSLISSIFAAGIPAYRHLKSEISKLIKGF